MCIGVIADQSGSTAEPRPGAAATLASETAPSRMARRARPFAGW